MKYLEDSGNLLNATDVGAGSYWTVLRFIFQGRMVENNAVLLVSSENRKAFSLIIKRGNFVTLHCSCERNLTESWKLNSLRFTNKILNM